MFLCSKRTIYNDLIKENFTALVVRNSDSWILVQSTIESDEYSIRVNN